MNSGKNDFLLLKIGCFIFSQLRNARRTTNTNIKAKTMIMIGIPSLIDNLPS